MLRKAKKDHQRGFTIAEIIIVAPIVLATLTGLVASIMFITTGVLRLGKANYQQQEILSAFDFIMEDLGVNSKVLDESLPFSESQDGETTTFKATDDKVLIISRPLLSSHSRDKNKDLIWIDQTNSNCSDNLTLSTINVVYFLDNNTLWRRTLMPNDWQAKTYCLDGNEVEKANLKEQPSCPDPDNDNPDTCLIKDGKVLTEVTEFKVEVLNEEKLIKITIKTKDQTVTKEFFVG